MRTQLLAAVLLAALPLSAYGQFTIPLPPGAAGSDGAFTFVGDAGTPTVMTIDLGSAYVGLWDAPSPVMGKGVYDPIQWAVVYKYTAINITSTQTVKFKNHPKGAPVVWLCQGAVTIDGTVDLRGKPGQYNTTRAAGGPGGFSGGVRIYDAPDASAGEGPGGGNKGCAGGSGGFGEQGAGGGLQYGSPLLLPLIGGSGGGGTTCNSGGGGGGGGGAILIASNMTITIGQSGVINTDGGTAANWAGHGSGGGIRLVANNIGGAGFLYARSGDSNLSTGVGRIRVETPPNQNTIQDSQCKPIPSRSTTPGSIFPAENTPANAPLLRIVNVSSMLPSADPFGSLLWSEDMLISKVNMPVTIRVEAKNVTLPANTTVQIRIVRAYGDAQTVISNPLLFDSGTSTYYSDTNLTIPAGRSVIQLRLPMP